MISKKPYDVCLECPHLGQSCDGPNFLAMTPERWVEWCLTRKKILNITNQHIADASNTPKGTVDRVLSGRGATDIRLSTMQHITQCLVGGTWGQFPCHDPLGVQSDSKELIDKIEAKDKQIAEIRAFMKEIQGRHAKELKEVRAESSRKVDFLKGQLKTRDKAIIALSIVAGVVILGFVALFIADAFTSGLGWLR